jgi:phosphate transport system substrate-binding protein
MYSTTARSRPRGSVPSRPVDFGGTDEPLSDDDLQKSGLVQFPTVIGGVVVVVNLDGVENNQLRLPPDVLAVVFLGKLTKWNDDRFKDANAGVELPDQNITVVHRADGSGTTFLYTSYLSQVSDDWKTKVGAGKSVEWPVGVGGKGNPGVAAAVAQVKGSIGYVEYVYAAHSKEKLKMTQLKNHDGDFLSASAEGFKAAARGADWSKSKNFTVNLLNQPGKTSWPITGATPCESSVCPRPYRPAFCGPALHRGRAVVCG